MEGERAGRRRRRWLVLGAPAALALVVVGLALSYLFRVVRDQPLAAAGVWTPGLGTELTSGQPAGTRSHPLEYRDGQTFVVEAWVVNNGRFGLTVTGVDTTPGWWHGLLSIADARAGVVGGRAPCCIVDEGATWAATSFQPFHLDAGATRPIALRLRVGHCEDKGVGIENILNDVTVHYDLIGNGHTAQVPIGPLVVRYGSADECPRPFNGSGTPLQTGSPPPTR
ncbi:MAG TPA: hypothetical protein VN193_17570 [Candidatus Angelobacter sp.]|jgi:hypothetical protein|nr:hypothetical protein [Candidatus Angelobacter sp.]